jgi:hypothetical protein
MALTNPKTTAATKAATKLLIKKPGTKFAVITNDTAVSSQVNKNCGMTVVEQLLPVSYLDTDILVLLAPREGWLYNFK